MSGWDKGAIEAVNISDGTPRWSLPLLDTEMNRELEKRGGKLDTLWKCSARTGAKGIIFLQIDRRVLEIDIQKGKIKRFTDTGRPLENFQVKENGSLVLGLDGKAEEVRAYPLLTRKTREEMMVKLRRERFVASEENLPSIEISDEEIDISGIRLPVNNRLNIII
jgi:hypothetical protein